MGPIVLFALSTGLVSRACSFLFCSFYCTPTSVYVTNAVLRCPKPYKTTPYRHNVADPMCETVSLADWLFTVIMAAFRSVIDD
ncbi:hypothetical protein AAHC03_04461 [Spirometra sp. Aus1]